MTFRFKESLIVILIPAFAFLNFDLGTDDIISLTFSLPMYALLYLVNPVLATFSGDTRFITFLLEILPDSYLESENWAGLAGVDDTYSQIMMLCWILALAFAVLSLVCNFIEQREVAGITLMLCGILMAVIQLLAYIEVYSDMDYLPIPFGWIGCLLVGWWIYTKHY